MASGLSYDDKRVVVTGCFSGMGEATARIVGDLGARVVAVDIREPAVPHEVFHEVDLRDPAAIDAAVAEIAGAGPIDRVFYCAGLPGGSFPDVDVVTVNFIGQKRFNTGCLEHMPGDGAVCSISSGAGVGYLAAMEQLKEFIALDFEAAQAWVRDELAATGFDAYAWSKMATIYWTLSQGFQITSQRGVRVNCISPGPTDTPMMPHFIEQTSAEFMDRYPKPVGRNSTPEEQAWVMAFVNSDLASYLSAENIYTDGGGCAGIMTGQVDIMALIAETN